MKLAYYLFATLILYACNNHNPNNKSGKINITNTFRTISVDEKTPTHLRKPLNVFITDTDTLLHFADGQNTIHFLSFTTQESKYSLKFDYNGPNGVGQFYRYYFLNFDSIYVNQHMTDIIYLLDSSKHVLNKVNYLGRDVSVSFDGFRVYHEGDKYYSYFASSAVGYWLEVNPMDSKIFIQSSLDGKKYEILDYTYPKSFEESKSTDLAIRPTFTKDKIIISFKGAHEVFVLDIRTNQIVEKKVASKFSTGMLSISAMLTDGNERIRYKAQHLSYADILWDKYKKVYYRFVKLPYNPDTGEDLNSISRYPPKYSLMVLDQDLNILAEEALKSRSYELRDSFVTLEGLWVSTHHPDNPNTVEGRFDFQLIKVTDIPQ